MFMPFSDFQNTSALTSLDTKALAADRLLTEPVRPPAPKEDFSKVFARIHKPREPERQDLAADEPPRPPSNASHTEDASKSRNLDRASPEKKKDDEQQAKRAVSSVARSQLLRLLRALQLADGTNTNAVNGVEGVSGLTSSNGTAFKASQLSDSVSVITAGKAPSEAEILAYAKELGLSPDAIKALMAELQASGLLGDQAIEENNSQQLSSVVTGDAEQNAEVFASLAPKAPQLVGAEDGTSRWLSLRGQITSPSESTTGAPQGPSADSLKGNATELGQSLSDRSAKDDRSSAEASTKSTDALSKVEKLLGPGALKEMLVGTAVERVMANKALMRQAAIKDGSAAGPLGLETIDLSEFAAELSNPLDRPALSSGSGSTGVFGLHASTSGESSGKSLGGETGTRNDGTGGSPRAFSTQLSQRFGEILGQRLLQQINQGNWKVELNLEPGDLGSIKVEMEFKKGELEASFKAGQAMTKDLLQDTLPKLREALERSGITIASMNVGGDRQERSGDSLSQQHSFASARRQSEAHEGEDVELEKAVTRRSHDGSLDVLV
jgi:hypothetical protein